MRVNDNALHSLRRETLPGFELPMVKQIRVHVGRGCCACTLESEDHEARCHETSRETQDVYCVTSGSDHDMSLGMERVESLCIPKVVFRNCALDVDGLVGPKGSYKFEDIRALVSELFDKADLHVMGQLCHD